MTDSRKENRIIFICWLAYAIAYVGRLNFGASIVAIVAETGQPKATVGLVSSFFFFAYGIGQLVNGILSKHYNGRYMVFGSLLISGVINFIMPMCSSVNLMKYIWLINGCVQSVLWTTLIKTISEFVSDKKMPSAIMAMSTTNTFGTFVVYGLSALYVKFFSWRWTFYTASILLFLTAILWFILYGSEKPPEIIKEKQQESQKSFKKSNVIWMMLITVALAGIANGFIKDGINTWVPNLLYEEFGVSQSFSILLTLLLPLVATLSAGVIKIIHDHIRSHNAMNVLLYTFSAVLCAGIILFLRIHSIVPIMLCFMLTSATMAMVNNVITSMFPLDRRTVINSGFAAGLLNTFCYVGSTVTAYSLGAVSEKSGWNSVFTIMLIVSVAAVAVSSVGALFDRKHKLTSTEG